MGYLKLVHVHSFVFSRLNSTSMHTVRFYGNATKFKGNRIHIHEALLSQLSAAKNEAKKFSLLSKRACEQEREIKWMRKMKCKLIWENYFKTIIISANIGKLIVRHDVNNKKSARRVIYTWEFNSAHINSTHSGMNHTLPHNIRTEWHHFEHSLNDWCAHIRFWSATYTFVFAQSYTLHLHECIHTKSCLLFIFSASRYINTPSEHTFPFCMYTIAYSFGIWNNFAG